MVGSRLGRTLATLAMASVIGSAPLAARAQHVVTEDEAGKLTLEALTAAPRPVYRPIYRSAYFRQETGPRYQHRAHGLQRTSQRTSRMIYAVSRVSYRVPFTHRAARHRR